MAPDEQNPKIVSDENWKDQAKKEKQKLEKENKGKDAETPKSPPTGPLPPVNFMTLVNSMVIQALYSMGRLGNGTDTPPEPNLDLAKYHIDMLDVLVEKTKGNLTDQESKDLSLALHEVRMQYVQIAQV